MIRFLLACLVLSPLDALAQTEPGAGPGAGRNCHAGPLPVVCGDDATSTTVSPAVTGSLTLAGAATWSGLPVANPLPTLSNFSIRGVTGSASAREFTASIGLVSDQGYGYPATPAAPNDKVALYVGAEGRPGTGPLWGGNISVTRNAGTGPVFITGLEVDVNDAAGDSWNTATPSRGITVTSGSTHHIVFAYESGSTTAANAPHVGYYSSAAVDADFFAQSSSADVLRVGGTHAQGLNTVGATVASPVLMAPDQAVAWFDVSRHHLHAWTHRSGDDKTVLTRDGVDQVAIDGAGQMTVPDIRANHLGVAGNGAASGTWTAGTVAATDHMQQASYPKADLPACQPGWTAFVPDGRNTGEAAGAGTGVLAYCTRGKLWYANGAPVRS